MSTIGGWTNIGAKLCAIPTGTLCNEGYWFPANRWLMGTVGGPGCSAGIGMAGGSGSAVVGGKF